MREKSPAEIHEKVTYKEPALITVQPSIGRLPHGWQVREEWLIYMLVMFKPWYIWSLGRGYMRAEEKMFRYTFGVGIIVVVVCWVQQPIVI